MRERIGEFICYATFCAASDGDEQVCLQFEHICDECRKSGSSVMTIGREWVVTQGSSSIRGITCCPFCGILLTDTDTLTVMRNRS
jgi:hypothetical protein